MSFQRIQLPFTSGLRDDTSDLDIESPGLAIADNVIYNKTGGISPRPALSSENGDVVFHGITDSSSVGDLSLVVNERLGLCGDDERLLLIEAGACFERRVETNTWSQVGTMWSAAMEREPLVGGEDATFPHVFTPHAGTTIFGYPTISPVGNYTTAGGLPAAPGAEIQRWAQRESRCVAGDALFLTNAGSLYMLRGFPVETTTLLAANALPGGAGTGDYVRSPQRLWAVTHAAGYYVFYQTATNCTLLDVNSAGAIVNTLTLTKGVMSSGNLELCLALGHNPTTTDLIVAVAGVSDQLYTYHINRTTFVDTNTDSVTTGVTPTETLRGVVCYVVPDAIDAFVAVYDDDSTHVYKRSSIGAVPGLTLHRSFTGTIGAGLTFQAGSEYRTWFPPTLFHGRLVMGLLHTGPPTSLLFAPRRGCTWLIVDITSATSSTPVACGEVGEALCTWSASQASILPTGELRCAYLEGTTFDVQGPLGARARAFRLRAEPPQSASTNGLTYFSGQVGYLFDGENTFEAGFLLPPAIRVEAGGPGLLAAGSHTFSAVYVYTDAQGNLHRSQPALKRTVVLGALSSVNITVSLPQITAKRPSGFAIEIYKTVVNPADTADLFNCFPQARHTFTSLAPGSFTITLTDDTGALFNGLTAQQALYTGGRILGDQRPLSNSGIAVVGSRIWCADGQRAFASKFVRNGVAPGWATDVDDLTLTVPTGYGPIRGISGIDNLLVLLCKNAVCVFTGQGPGDTGGPSDFSEPRQVYKAAGPARPSDIAVTRESIYWASDKGDAHAFGQSSRGSQLSRPAGNRRMGKPAFIPGSQTDHDRIVFMTDEASTLAVFDVELNLWSTWTLHQPLVDIVSSRRGLHTLFEDDPYVGSYINLLHEGEDNPGGPFEQHVEVKLVPLGHLGRIKSIQPKGRYTNNLFSDDLEVTVYVLSDRGKQAIPGNSKVFSVPISGTAWPRDEFPELRLEQQRMEAFAVGVKTSHGCIELKGAEVRLKRENESPRNNRK